MANCIRCGQKGTQYGTDGLSYCDSHIFYGMNKQCQRCGMYLPKLELQMYRGQWHCQYCVMDLRDEHREDYGKKTGYAAQNIKYEHCGRCGTVISDTVYIFKGRKLCLSCVNHEKGEDSGPTTPPVMKISIRKKEEPAFTPIIKTVGVFSESLFGWILRKLGLKKKQERTEIVSVIEEEEKLSKKDKKSSKDDKEDDSEDGPDWSKHKKD